MIEKDPVHGIDDTEETDMPIGDLRHSHSAGLAFGLGPLAGKLGIRTDDLPRQRSHDPRPRQRPNSGAHRTVDFQSGFSGQV